MQTLLDKFKLGTEKEDLKVVIEQISQGVVFRGTNLWILIFAIFVASLGLNLNATAVIIGAMLISPLMGPIMGIGLGIGINDLSLLKTAFSNLLIAVSVSLLSSTVFFLISPLNEAHSEILSRTSPTFYDLLIALFGGSAGIIAVATKNKGNVIPGVAIATALMPPLCTAGYGLATLQFGYFFGAFYLFIINTVFIALSTFIIVQVLHFPKRKARSSRAEKVTQRTVWMIAFVTFIPSVYFGYDMVRKNEFNNNANRFIASEARFPNDYLLEKKIDPKAKKISLVFGGKKIMPDEIKKLEEMMKFYGLSNTTLEVKQGFSNMSEESADPFKDKISAMDAMLKEKEAENYSLRQMLDTLNDKINFTSLIHQELSILFPTVEYVVLPKKMGMGISQDSISNVIILVVKNGLPSKNEQAKIKTWLELKTGIINPTIKYKQ